MDAHKNFAYSTIAVAPSPASSGTSLDVASGEGALFPDVPFNCTVWPAGAIPLASNAEIIRVTGISGDTFTIERTQEGTSARAIVAGDQINAPISDKTLTDIEQNKKFDYLLLPVDGGPNYHKVRLVTNPDGVVELMPEQTPTP